MKTRMLATALAMSTIALLSGCGSSNNGSNPLPGSNIIGYTQQCTPQGCVQVPIYGTPGGCIPLNQPIYFAGSGAQISGQTLAAGIIPNGGSNYGTLSLSSSPINVGTGQTVTSVSAGSQLTMSISGGGYGTSTASVAGSLQLSAAIQQQIAYYNQGMGSYTGVPGYTTGTPSYSPFVQPGYGQSSVCVSGIALQGYLYGTVPAFTGTAFLYLNNTQHGWALPMY